MRNDIISTALSEKVITIAFLLSFFCVLAYPVADPDVFWHIKTGEWIWDHKSLPQTDPFSYTVDTHLYYDQSRPSVMLKQYWLAQLLLYGLHSMGGLYGIFLFRFLTYIALFSLLFFWMRKRGVHRISVFFFLLPLFLIVFAYGGERPNTLSYFLAAAVSYLADEFTRSGEEKIVTPYSYGCLSFHAWGGVAGRSNIMHLSLNNAYSPHYEKFHR